MAFTYTITNDLGKVRFFLQDTAEATAMLQDEEILYALSTEANVYCAAAMCADILASRARGVSSKSIGSLSISYSRADWEATASRLRMRGESGYPTAGGIEIEDRVDLAADTALIQPTTFAGLGYNPDVVPPSRSREGEES